MHRITERDLEAVVERINRMLDKPLVPWSRRDGKLVANIGNYHISLAYGGAALHQTVSEGGGIRDVFSSGHIPKRELYYQMQSFITGISEQTKERA